MSLRPTLVVLASAGLVVVYGACTEARLDPLAVPSANVDDEEETPEPPGNDAAVDDAGGDGEGDAAVADASQLDGSDGGAWPCPTPKGGPSLDREWATGPLPPSSPGPDNYATTAATVCDRTTLLEWERKISTEERTWDEANDYCDSLLLDGKSDWRLPTRIELITLVDYTKKDPAIDTTVFPETPVASFWSSTIMSNVFGEPNAYLVAFDYGHAAPWTKGEKLLVRCVRGGR